MQIDDLIEAELVTSCVDQRPDKTPEEWDAAHYAFTLTVNGKTFQGFYSMGWGHFTKAAKTVYAGGAYGSDKALMVDCLTGRRKAVEGTRFYQELQDFKKRVATKKGQGPKVDQVLCSLLMDASSSDQNLEDWCADYGYSDDSIKAKETWEACNKIRRFLESAIPADKLQTLYERSYEE